MAWLVSRQQQQQRVVLDPQPLQPHLTHQQNVSELGGQLQGAAAVAAAPQAVATHAGGRGSCQAPATSPPRPTPLVEWHVTGLDSWPGALHRCQELLQVLGASPSRAALHLATVDSESGRFVGLSFLVKLIHIGIVPGLAQL